MVEGSTETREAGGPKRISFPEFLSYRNPRDDKYRHLTAADIRYLERGASNEASQDSILRLLEHRKTKDYLKSKLEGEILIDCGGGREEFIKPYIVDLQAGSYVNLDGQLTEYDPQAKYVEYAEPMPEREGWILFSARLREPKMQGNTLIHGINGEMLRVIARMPDNSVNFVLNGIDFDSNTENSDYWKALAFEISRATSEGGVVFGYGTPFFEYLDRKKFKDTGFADTHMQGIFEKI